MADKTLFQKIIDRDIPGDIVYEDDQVVAFKDVDPKAPIHILIVPRKPIPTVDDILETDEQLIGRMFTAAKKIARAKGIDQSGYRLIINCKQDGGQVVYHLHMHLLGGAPLGPKILPQDLRPKTDYIA